MNNFDEVEGTLVGVSQKKNSNSVLFGNDIIPKIKGMEDSNIISFNITIVAGDAVVAKVEYWDEDTGEILSKDLALTELSVDFNARVLRHKGVPIR